MSTIVKYSSGSTYTLVANKVDIEKVQELGGQYHVPYSSMVGMVRLGLGIQKITVTGDTLDMTACVWHDVVAISLDSGTSYQTVYFSGVPYTSDCWSGIYPYALSLLASPLKEQTAVRYPTTGYKWGNQSITGISQAGNVNAFPIIHYLAPLFYAPLSNTLIDFAGQSVTFTRTAAKSHGGVAYPINTPIFDSGLYLASDTAQDVATWTPPASTVRTVAMQLTISRPAMTNLVPNGEFETNITGWTSGVGTMSRTTVSPLVGTGSLKILVAANGDIYSYEDAFTVIAGHTYVAYCAAKSTAAAGRMCHLQAGGDTSFNGPSTDCSGGGRLAITFVAAGVNLRILPVMSSALVGEYLLVDSVFCYDLTAAYGDVLTVWTSVHNVLTIEISANTVTLTSPGNDVISVAFPFFEWWFASAPLEVVIIDDISHAVTIAVHPAGGSWTSAAGTLAALTWPQLTLGNLEGSVANLIEYPYVLTSAEYQAITYSSLSLLFNALYIGNRYAGEIIKGSDKRLVNANGADISALLGGTDIAIGSTAGTIAQSQGLAARWYVEVKRTDV